MRRVAILGSTGSIGRSSLDVARSHRDAIDVVAVSARRNIDELARQITEFEPLVAVVGDDSLVHDLRERLGRSSTEIIAGEEALETAASLPEADIVLNALVGAAGVKPTIAAIRAGNDLAIANKECLVAAGEVITREARAAGVNLIPVDSEHSAIYQCLKSEERSSVARITLTASGGPLLDKSPVEIEAVTAEDALRHPTWVMGAKVTIDSATLLNKGFEVLEAHWLFGIPAGRIRVLVERKSIVHCLVEFVDGSVTALLSQPDMRLPIQYALTQPERLPTSFPKLDLMEVGEILFEPPDLRRFPCLQLAYEVADLGGTAPAALSAADEVAVDSFLAGDIKFGDIYSILKEVVERHRVSPADNLDSVLEATSWARRYAQGLVRDTGGDK